MARLDRAFQQLFLSVPLVSITEIEWRFSFGEDEALRQQEANVKPHLQLALGVDLKRYPAIAGDIAEMVKAGRSASHSCRGWLSPSFDLCFEAIWSAA
jgi:hypothetical protein